MTKYLLIGLVAAGLFASGTAYAAVRFSANTPKGVLVGAVEITSSKDAGVYKIVDGLNTCYIVASELPAISCVK